MGMRFRILLPLLLSSILAVSTASANLIDRGIYTYDSQTNVDWLDLNVLAGISYDQTLAGAGGYTTSGWRYATTTEILDLFSRYVGPANGGYLGYATNDGYIPDFSVPNGSSSDMFQNAYDIVVMMGMNLAFNDNRATYNVDWEPAYVNLHQVSIQGYFDDENVGPNKGLAELTAVVSPIDPLALTGEFTPFGRWAVFPDRDDAPARLNVSSFLVRSNPVPVPGTSILLLVGLLALSAARRGRNAVVPSDKKG